MRSGTGRHRRPRQAPAILVTAGVTSAGIATTLLGASGAQAAEASTWDRVAECESGGTWSTDEDSGYYGGLQLTLTTWQKYGGTVYAERPDLASRVQQIEIAEKILAAEGPQAWPGCAVTSGLTAEYNGVPEPEKPVPGEGDPNQSDGIEDPERIEEPVGGTPDGTGDAEEPEESEDSGGPGGGGADDSDGVGDTSVPAPGGSAEDGAGKGKSKDDRAEQGKDADRLDAPAGEDDAADRDGDRDRDGTPDGSSGGKHRGQPDPEDAAGDREGAGRHADRSARDGGYLVEDGDTLSRIAEKHHVDGGWPALYQGNEKTVGEDPDLILPGQLLKLGADIVDSLPGK